LGFDPLYVANEGRFVCILPSHEADRALDVLRRFPVTARAVKVGKVEEAATGLVTLHSRIGASRIVDMLSGEQLPRIC
jgi:hydrogenase expression/formation protein HypE